MRGATARRSCCYMAGRKLGALGAQIPCAGFGRPQGLCAGHARLRRSDRPPTGEDGDALPPWIETGAVALGLDTFDLVGFSFGAMVAGFYAASFPSRVKRLVLVGAPGFNRTPGPKANLKEWLRLPDGPGARRPSATTSARWMVARDETVDDLSLTLLRRGPETGSPDQAAHCGDRRFARHHAADPLSGLGRVGRGRRCCIEIAGTLREYGMRQARLA